MIINKQKKKEKKIKITKKKKKKKGKNFSTKLFFQRNKKQKISTSKTSTTVNSWVLIILKLVPCSIFFLLSPIWENIRRLEKYISTNKKSHDGKKIAKKVIGNSSHIGPFVFDLLKCMLFSLTFLVLMQRDHYLLNKWTELSFQSSIELFHKININRTTTNTTICHISTMIFTQHSMTIISATLTS